MAEDILGTSTGGTAQNTEQYAWYSGNNNDITVRIKNSITDWGGSNGNPSSIDYDAVNDWLFVSTSQQILAKFDNGLTPLGVRTNAERADGEWITSVGRSANPYIFSGAFDGTFSARQKSDLTDVWSVTNQWGDTYIWGTCYTINDQFYAVTSDGSGNITIREIDPSNGNQLNSRAITPNINGVVSAVVSNSLGQPIVTGEAYTTDLSSVAWTASEPRGGDAQWAGDVITIGNNDKCFLFYDQGANETEEPYVLCRIDGQSGSLDETRDMPNDPIAYGGEMMLATPEYLIIPNSGKVSVSNADAIRLNYDLTTDWRGETGDLYPIASEAGDYSTFNDQSQWTTP